MLIVKEPSLLTKGLSATTVDVDWAHIEAAIAHAHLLRNAEIRRIVGALARRIGQSTHTLLIAPFAYRRMIGRAERRKYVHAGSLAGRMPSRTDADAAMARAYRLSAADIAALKTDSALGHHGAPIPRRLPPKARAHLAA